MDYQDVLALLNVSHAHPGGRSLTRLWLDRVAPPADAKVLEVGCGTGASLTWMRQRYGCEVTGVDVRPAMVEAARRRAAGDDRMRVLVASAEALPFADAEFDLVYTESVNVFIDAPQALAEYHRVLKPGGQYVDVEMMLLWPVSDTWKAEACRVYGVKQVPDQRGWKALYRAAGFDDVSVLISKPVRVEDMAGGDAQVDPNHPGLRNPEVVRVLRDNAAWMERNAPYLAYAAFLCRKPR